MSSRRLAARALVLAFGIVPALVGAQPPQQGPDAMARALQKRYQAVLDFSGDFAQTYRGGALRTQTRESGTVSIKKPGRMRWVYTRPEKKEFVSDGRKLYAYIPEDRQVIVSDVPADDQATTAALFLAGKGDISRDFTAAHADSSIPGAAALKLTPRSAQPDYDYLVVTVDTATLQIRAITTRDHQGGESMLTFSNLRENQGLSDKDFVFSVPRGVTVITNDTRN